MVQCAEATRADSGVSLYGKTHPHLHDTERDFMLCGGGILIVHSPFYVAVSQLHVQINTQTNMELRTRKCGCRYLLGDLSPLYWSSGRENSATDNGSQ